MAKDNGSTDPKPESMFEKIQKEFVAKGTKRPAAKEIELLKKAIFQAETEVQEAEAALEKAQTRKYEVAAKTMRALGTKTRLEIPGLGVLTPAGRGDRVFYKRASDTDTV